MYITEYIKKKNIFCLRGVIENYDQKQKKKLTHFTKGGGSQFCCHSLFFDDTAYELCWFMNSNTKKHCTYVPKVDNGEF